MLSLLAKELKKAKNMVPAATAQKGELDHPDVDREEVVNRIEQEVADLFHQYPNFGKAVVFDVGPPFPVDTIVIQWSTPQRTTLNQKVRDVKHVLSLPFLREDPSLYKIRISTTEYGVHCHSFSKIKCGH
jgi:hypothetical protein